MPALGPAATPWLAVLAVVLLAVRQAGGLKGATVVGDDSHTRFPAVVEIRDGSLARCTATFVARQVLITAGRCVVALSATGQPVDSSQDGDWARPSTMFPNLTVWGGAGTSTIPMRYLGRAVNASWVYRTGTFGDNVGLLQVDLRASPGVTVGQMAIRTDGFVFPESGAIVGVGSNVNVGPSAGGGFAGAGVHRSGPAEILEATQVFAYSGNCVKRKDGGALVLQDYNTIQFPKACLASGDFGAALLVQQQTGSRTFQLAGVAAQGDSYPCTNVRTYMSSVLYRQNWIQERINAFSGNRFAPIVCPSPSATPTAAPSITPSPSLTPSPSASPSTVVEIVPPREIDWGVILALGGILICLCCSACGAGVYYWVRVRRGLATAVSPDATKDPTLQERIEAKHEAVAGQEGKPQPPQQALDADAIAAKEAERAERRRKARDSRQTRNRKVLDAQRAKRAMQQRAARSTNEGDRHVRVGATDVSRFGGTGHGHHAAAPVKIAAGPAEAAHGDRDSKRAPAGNPRQQRKFNGTGVSIGAAAPGPSLGRPVV